MLRQKSDTDGLGGWVLGSVGFGLTLTLIPSNRDNALKGLRALRVLRDLMGPISEYPRELAMRLTNDT